MQQPREGPIERICHETLRKFMRPPKGKFGIALFWILEHCELVPNIIIIIFIYLCYIFQPTNIIIFFFRARFFNSGCTDAFTAFAFLAFLLALLDLILELQSGNFNAFPKLFFSISRTKFPINSPSRNFQYTSQKKKARRHNFNVWLHVWYFCERKKCHFSCTLYI